MKGRKVPAAEVKRLARIGELAREQRRAERALERAMRAAHARGIGTRRIAAAAGIPPVTAWRVVRPGNGQASDATGPAQPANGATKGDRARKKAVPATAKPGKVRP